MYYFSLKSSQLKTGFSQALLSSLAPDGGLYMPSALPRFGDDDLTRMGAMSFADCAGLLARYFVDDHFEKSEIEAICKDAYTFPLPLKTLLGEVLDPALVEPDQSEYILELFHGPTLAFKDFAARFMGRTVSHRLTKTGETRTILVATSGDTGGAIGHAFLDQDGVEVYILFPQGGVSPVQEHQLTAMGPNANVTAIAIDGTFDDCQALVKQAFADQTLSQDLNLMSANSINVGRVIPQSFYYFWTSLQLKAAYPNRPIVYSIPSGNLGNLTGGLFARKMGAPIDHFVVGNNVNDPFVDYLNTGDYRPRDSIPTLSNAMDIGRPNNFARILALFANDHTAMKAVVSGYSFSDQETERHIRRQYADTGYLMCPHTAVGHLAMRAYCETHSDLMSTVTVSTAHPAKFLDNVERIIHETISVPEDLQQYIEAQSYKHVLAPELDALSSFIRSRQS